MRMILALSFCLTAMPALAQQLAVPPGDPEAAAPVLARSLLGAPLDRPARFRVQLAAGDERGALAELDALRKPDDPSARVRARYIEYALYARARLSGASVRAEFDNLTLDAPADAVLVNLLSYDNLRDAMSAWTRDADGLKGKTEIRQADAIQLVRDYADQMVDRALAAEAAAIVAEDDARRYVIDRDVRVSMPDGGTVCALIVRPPSRQRLPTLLQFTIYNDPGAIMRDARRAAAEGYVGVIGLTRGKGCSPDAPVPYVHDGADAAALIDWIAAQPWSDGRVGMYGGSYSGFTPWAAAKHRPKALKAIMVGAAGAPGIDTPMEGGVYWNFLYPWPFYTTDNKTLDNATYGDSTRWQKLDRDYYTSGRAYRDLDRIDGTPNPVFDEWVAHPTYDAFWQSLIPYRRDFAAIDIPVLQTAGYYYGGPGAAVYYLSSHYRYRPDAQHYLVIGPYDHFMAQRGTANEDGDLESIAGYRLDPAALIDLVELRYRWFDHVFKGAPMPPLLANRINYEVTGADEWKHAPSLAAMANGRLRLYLAAGGRLGAVRSRKSIVQIVDFRDRSDAAAQTPGGGVQDTALDSTNGLVFASDPLPQATELSGLFSGHLDFTANKRDFDFQISLYEKTTGGDYIQLAPYWSRASMVGGIEHRRLLVPGRTQHLNFQSVRLMSRRLAAGSRIVAVLQILKQVGRQINYGTGKPVSDESAMDAGAPLSVTWSGTSRLEIPEAR